MSHKIVQIVSRITGVNISDIKSRSRKREFSTVRHACCFFLKTYTNLTLKGLSFQVGDYGKHHATVIHAIRNYEGLFSNDPTIKKQYNLILDAIREEGIIDKRYFFFSAALHDGATVMLTHCNFINKLDEFPSNKELLFMVSVMYPKARKTVITGITELTKSDFEKLDL